MKTLIALAVISMSFVQIANASPIRNRFYCTTGNPFTEGVSKTNYANVQTDNSVSGALNGKTFSFADRYPVLDKKNGVMAWVDSDSKIKVEVQLPSPYDGVQDTLWGRMTVAGKAKGLNCYMGY